MRNGSSTSLTGWQEGDPTPEDIAAITADIRRSWSHREHYVRAGKRVPGWLSRNDDPQAAGWTAPVVSLGGGVGEPVE